MKHTDKFAVLRNKETGAFLDKYKSKKGTFAYSAEYTEELRRAAKNELKAIESQKEDFEKLANALNCEILVVEAEYTLKTLDGKEPEDLTEDIEDAKRKYIEGLLKGLLNDDVED
jgi:hypothetical protein|nr:MAG TPA: hypothetical protein [Caudoviricetes sp.]